MKFSWPKRGRMRTWLRVAAAVAGIAMVAYVGLIVALASLQDLFIFHPSRAILMTPESLHIPYEQVRLQTADGETIAGWYIAREEPALVILFFHGNAGNVSDRLPKIAELRHAGFAVLIVDYRGYGESSGRPSEAGLHVDALAAWDHLTKSRGVPPHRIVLYGESLGSVPALALSVRQEGRSEGPAAVVLEGAFTSAVEMGRRAFPFLPIRWILRAEMDNLSAVRNLRAPILFLHAGNDEVAPLEMGHRLYEASTARLKEFHEVPGTWHNTVWTERGRALGETVRDFVARAVPSNGPDAP
jgi:hypothetical protein